MASLSYPIVPRLLYGALLSLALPLLAAHLLYRSLRQPAYRRFFGERLGHHRKSVTRPIWLHAASLGEVQAAVPLLAALRAEHVGAPMLITCQTPAGRQAAEALALADCTVAYLPFDSGFCVRAFLRRVRPRIALVLETEIWPTLFLQVRRAGIPLLLLNARVTERSLWRYRRLAIFRHALALPQAIACQSAGDAERFRAAGALDAALSVSGNLKWDRPETSSVAVRVDWPQTPVWMAASTHPEEEPAVLEAHRSVLREFPQALLLWAPRHLERFEPVALMVQKAGLALRRRSQDALPDADTRVFLIDTHGELAGFMPGSDLVFVGGSLQAIGGHNVLEPAGFGLPVLVGPHTAHFNDSVAALQTAGGLLQVPDAEALAVQLTALLHDPARRAAMGAANAACVAASRGALEKTKALVAQRLAKGS